MTLGIRFLFFTFLAASIFTPLAECQHRDNFTPRKLLAVSVTGTQRFKSDDVAAASGLTIGMTAGEDEFRRAAERLGDTGAFSDVTYSYSYSDAGAKLTLQVKDAEEFVPARFEDFVGFTDDELRARIKRREPLFDGTLPAAGKLAGQVSDVLQGLLIEKHIPGHVEYDRMVREEGGKVQAILFSIEGASIVIRQAHVSGAGWEEATRLQTIADHLKDRDYKRSMLDSLVETQLLPILQENGYLKAEVNISPPKLVPAPSDVKEDSGQATLVDIEFAVQPGRQYRFSGVDWAGNKAIASDKLNSFLHVRNGEVANAVQLAADLHHALQLYGSIGYIQAAVKLDPRFDDAAGTVQYVLKVTEGDPFKMGELDIRGVDRPQEAQLRTLWKLRPGDIYNSEYLQSFLPDAVKLLPKSFDWVTTHHVTANARDKTVDVEVTFTAQATR